MVRAFDPSHVLERVRADVERNAVRVRNAVKLASGSIAPTVGASPKDVVWRAGRSQLWHYRNDAVIYGPPLLIVYSLVSRSYVMDLATGNSLVERLVADGFDVYLLDWGVPDERDAANRFEDYVAEFLPSAIERIRADSGSDRINLLGYCFGGVLALLYAASQGDQFLRSLILMATPVDFDHTGPVTRILRDGGLDVDDLLGPDGNIPASVIFSSFRTIQPTGEIASYVGLWDNLWNDQYLVGHQTIGRWAKDHIPFPGGVARQAAQMLVKDNGFVTDRISIAGEHVRLAGITVPLLAIVATNDHIVPEAAAMPVIDLVGSVERETLPLPAGHAGLFVGRSAAKTTVPKIVEFLKLRSEAV